MLDLPVTGIAEQLDFPVGRRALAAELGEAFGAETLATIEPMNPAIQDPKNPRRKRKVEGAGR
jgi:hypothetical protein